MDYSEYCCQEFFIPTQKHNSLLKIAHSRYDINKFILDDKGYGYFDSFIKGYIMPDPEFTFSYMYKTMPWTKVLIITIKAPFNCDNNQIAYINNVLNEFDRYYSESVDLFRQRGYQIPVTNNDFTRFSYPIMQGINIGLRWRN